MNNPIHLGLLDRRELDEFAEALDTAGKVFASWLAEQAADGVVMPDASATKMYWSFVAATAPDDRIRSLAFSCARMVSTGNPN